MGADQAGLVRVWQQDLGALLAGPLGCPAQGTGPRVAPSPLSPPSGPVGGQIKSLCAGPRAPSPSGPAGPRTSPLGASRTDCLFSGEREEAGGGVGYRREGAGGGLCAEPAGTPSSLPPCTTAPALLTRCHSLDYRGSVGGKPFPSPAGSHSEARDCLNSGPRVGNASLHKAARHEAGRWH